jgi:hypothetical protein
MTGWLLAGDTRAQVSFTLSAYDINDAYLEVLGREVKDHELQYWQSVALASKQELASELKHGLTLPDAASELVDVINRAYFIGFGRFSTGDEYEYWKKKIMSKPLGYSDVLNAARKWLQTEAGAKDAKEMIERAYQMAMGRAATAEDQSYWLNSLKQKSIIFPELVTACVKYMLGPERRQRFELRSMVKRAYKAAGIAAPSEYELDAWEKIEQEYKEPYTMVLLDLKKLGPMTQKVMKM